jgi:hypothetical protein
MVKPESGADCAQSFVANRDDAPISTEIPGAVYQRLIRVAEDINFVFEGTTSDALEIVLRYVEGMVFRGREVR